MKRLFMRRKTVVEFFAKEIAELNRKADVAFYINDDRDHASWLLDAVWHIKNLAAKMGICKEVYDRAYEIYDFRNSGKSGYTLKDGKIVKAELLGGVADGQQSG